MLLAVMLLLAGAAVLTVGAEAAVRGSAGAAGALGITPFVIGALLFGVDIEGLGATALAAGRGETGLSAGGAFGTIVFLFSIAFGLALLLSPRPVQAPSRPMILWPAPALAAAAVVVFDLRVTRPEGAALVILYGIYVWQVVHEARAVRKRTEELQREAAEVKGIPPWILLVGGLGLVALGASLLVEGGVRVLDITALKAGFVGAAILGALVSADEVLLEVLPVRRGVQELATGNLFGTLAAFTTIVVGLAALIRPLDVDSAGAFALIAVAVLYALVATVFLARGRAGKATGLAVLAVYGLWVLVGSRI